MAHSARGFDVLQRTDSDYEDENRVPTRGIVFVKGISGAESVAGSLQQPSNYTTQFITSKRLSSYTDRDKCRDIDTGEQQFAWDKPAEGIIKTALKQTYCGATYGYSTGMQSRFRTVDLSTVQGRVEMANGILTSRLMSTSTGPATTMSAIGHFCFRALRGLRKTIETTIPQGKYSQLVAWVTESTTGVFSYFLNCFRTATLLSTFLCPTHILMNICFHGNKSYHKP